MSHNHGAIWTHLTAVETQSVATNLPYTHLVLKKKKNVEGVRITDQNDQLICLFNTLVSDIRWVKNIWFLGRSH